MLRTDVATVAYRKGSGRACPLSLRGLLSCTLVVACVSAGCRDGVTEPFKTANSGHNVAVVIIRPGSVPSMALFRSVALSAELRDSGGLLVSGPVSWSTSDLGVVRLTPTPSKQVLVSAIRIGTATITASSGSKSASVVITVHGPGPVETISLLSPASLALGTVSRLVAVARDSDGVQVTAIPTFASSNPAVVSVSAAGELIARGEGTATLSATSNGKVGSSSIVVTAGARAFMWTAAGGMTDLGVLPGFVMSTGTAVSPAGHVAGTLSTVADSLSHAFVRPPGSGAVLVDLGGLTTTGSSGAFGVNSSGRVVGYAIAGDGKRHAVSWNAAGAIQDLGTLPGDVESEARAINDAGQIVGWSRSASRAPRSFIWTEATGMRQVPGSELGAALAISQAGVVGGQAGVRPYVWSPTTGFRSLAPMSGDDAGWVVAINAAGETVGKSIGCADADYYDDCYPQPEECVVLLTTVGCAPDAEHPVWWLDSVIPVDLRKASASGSFFTAASGINLTRQVVGTNASGRALLWSGSGAPRDLGVVPGRSKSAALAINDAGVVVGWSGNP